LDNERFACGPITHVEASAIILRVMDPLALLPYALAASGGRMGPYDTTQLVAAGLTLLQRSASLVRALSGRRSGLLLPNGPAWIVALAASEGRGVVVMDRAARHDDLVTFITHHRIGVVFTSTALADRLPDDCPRVLLDEAPVRAQITVGDRHATVDLGTHFGLDLVGDSSVAGADEECVVYAGNGEILTHRALLANARHAMADHRFTPMDRTVSLSDWAQPGVLPCGLLAPLLAGGTLHDEAFSGMTAPHAVAPHPFTKMVGTPTAIEAFVTANPSAAGVATGIALTQQS